MKKLRVLHIGNTAAIPKTLRDNLRRDGINSDIMTFYPDVLKQGSDFAYPYPKIVRMILPLYGAFRVYHMLKKIRDYDILHFHAFGGLTFYLDYPLWRLLGKKIVLHYHGTELRRWGHEWPCAKLAHKRYVSTLDLLHLAPGAEWLPSPLDISDFEYVGINEKCENEKIIILNAVASEIHGKTKKGLDVIREAIDIIKNKGYNIEFRSLIGVPHAEALKQYQESDIIIGQTHIGWYGKMEQECMAYGKPVVTYIDKNVEHILPDISPIPAVSFERDSAQSLAQSVIDLIDDYNRRKELSISGRKYVEKWHDSEIVMSRLKEQYYKL